MSELPKLILPAVKDMRIRIDKRKFEVKEVRGNPKQPAYWVVTGRREEDLDELLVAYLDLFKHT